MTTSTTLLNPIELRSEKLSQVYEIIENENVNGENFKNLTVSGALFSLSTFKTSSFSSCVFYSCKWENTVFKNCTFENCTFQFSHLYDVQFTSCKFINCAWEFTTAKKSKALSSELDRATAKEFSKYDNNTINCCFASDPELTQRSIELIELHKEWDKAA